MIVEKNPITQLALTSIRTDGGTQPRAEINYDTVREYAQDMMIDVRFPPVTVFYDGTDYWLADGFHRYHATKQLCKETIDADIKQGTRREAVLHSVGANSTHGLRRTNADKRRAVETLLRDPEWGKWSNREIARRSGVAESSVRNIKENLTAQIAQSENRTYINRYGDVATMNTGNIGRTSQPEMPFLPFQELARQELAQEQEDFEEDLEEEEEKEPSYTYDGSKPAYCKYCYKTHYNWTYNGESWVCYHCDYGTSDEYMQIAEKSDDEEEKEQESTEDEWEIEEEKNEYSVPIPQPIPPTMPTPTHPQQEEILPTPDIEAKERRDAHTMRVMGSSDSPEWYTPSDIIKAVVEVMGEIELDPCSNSHETPTVPAHTLYTKEDNGLSKQWKGKTYLNPPYGSEIGTWTNKLISSYESGDIEEAIALLPGRIDTNWFSPLYAYIICIVHGRVQFANSPYHAPFPCVLVYLGKRENAFIDTFKAIGPIVKRID